MLNTIRGNDFKFTVASNISLRSLKSGKDIYYIVGNYVYSGRNVITVIIFIYGRRFFDVVIEQWSQLRWSQFDGYGVCSHGDVASCEIAS